MWPPILAQCALQTLLFAAIILCVYYYDLDKPNIYVLDGILDIGIENVWLKLVLKKPLTFNMFTHLKKVWSHCMSYAITKPYYSLPRSFLKPVSLDLEPGKSPLFLFKIVPSLISLIGLGCPVLFSFVLFLRCTDARVHCSTHAPVTPRHLKFARWVVVWKPVTWSSVLVSRAAQ